ncbi:hypothetical protein ACN26Y_28680 [Micromonospora sp. WMMD558]|uniref:hypothetical protein n=1 Tax=Micromonospora sp. WMMD558 TaxID=3403462 RepID=UPI003BF5C3D6
MSTKRWRIGGRNMRVVPMRDMDELRRYIHEHRTTDLILDVEPWLVHWSEPAEVLAARMVMWQDPAFPQCTVRLCTNSTRFSPLDVTVRLISAARKPRTARCHLGQLGERPLVAGDLLLLDGLLARRLPADFAWLKWRGASPPWPRALRAADRVAAPLLLVGR